MFVHALTWTGAATALGLIATAGCASRAVPSRLPPQAPAAATATSAPAAHVTTMLETDPGTVAAEDEATTDAAAPNEQPGAAPADAHEGHHGHRH